jgi:hypothetical protein
MRRGSRTGSPYRLIKPSSSKPQSARRFSYVLKKSSHTKTNGKPPSRTLATLANILAKRTSHSLAHHDHPKTPNQDHNIEATQTKLVPVHGRTADLLLSASQPNVAAAECSIAVDVAVDHLVEAITAVEVAVHRMDEAEGEVAIRVSTIMWGKDMVVGVCSISIADDGLLLL